MKKQRLDLLLVELNLCDSRQLAQRWIQAGEVRVNGEVVDKAGTDISVTAEIEVKARARFVSRGGEKLVKALEVFEIATVDRTCLDAGISTGGFTDCLLQAGAKQVYGIDVGYGQVDWKIRTDERVILRERTNIRHLTPAELYGEPTIAGDSEVIYPVAVPDFAVVDVSFISIAKILPALFELLAAPKELLLLVNPQFEVGKHAIGKRGVVRGVLEHVEKTALRRMTTLAFADDIRTAARRGKLGLYAHLAIVLFNGGVFHFDVGNAPLLFCR